MGRWKIIRENYCQWQKAEFDCPLHNDMALDGNNFTYIRTILNCYIFYTELEIQNPSTRPPPPDT